MRYFVSLDADPESSPVGPVLPVLVELTELPSGVLEARVDGRQVSVDVATLGRHLSILVGGQVVELTAEGVPPDLGVIASGHRSYVRVESERMRAADQARGGSTGLHEQVVRSPMPGRVVKVLVAEGDVVQAGQGLVVLEAMKMENEVRARAAGKVGQIHALPGTAVERNAKLVTLS